ncbi:MAG: hypothetical protein AMJ81_08080 [Phycisphaerae bacterium SM23_33]|nr:MAG: hypothetical protein AMJ81_08080 [Phycisphaerae bacterium SM23_33]
MTMTQIPQPNEAPDRADAPPDSGGPAQTFQPILYDAAPKKPPRNLLIVVGACVLSAVVGLIFCRGKPHAAQANTPALDVGSMSAQELAESASVPAARELARRMVSGTPAEQAAASSAITCRRSPRLARNLAMAMALEQQKRQQQLMLQMRRHQQMAVEGPYGDSAKGQ